MASLLNVGGLLAPSDAAGIIAVKGIDTGLISEMMQGVSPLAGAPAVFGDIINIDKGGAATAIFEAMGPNGGGSAVAGGGGTAELAAQGRLSVPTLPTKGGPGIG